MIYMYVFLTPIELSKDNFSVSWITHDKDSFSKYVTPG